MKSLELKIWNLNNINTLDLNSAHFLKGMARSFTELDLRSGIFTLDDVQ
ncbi:MAG: hypothetical protein ACUVQ3_03600 [bacterium]